MGAYRLRQGDRSVHLHDGELVVGRGIECDLVLDDPLVSRKHAVFRPRAGSFEVEDLQSKNGTRVNSNAVTGPTLLVLGDRISIGSHVFEFLEWSEDTDSLREWLTPDPVLSGDTLSDSRASSAVSLLAAVAERALAAGDVEHACRVVRSLASSVKKHCERGNSLPDDVLGAASLQILGLAERTGDGEWLDRLFEVYVAAGRVIDVVAVDQLDRLAPQIGYVPGDALRAYLTAMHEPSRRLTAYHRFLLDRLSALSRRLEKKAAG
jgi:hypothetical protein